MVDFSLSDDESLVQLVYKNPPLYDTKLVAYKDATVREIIWEDISTSLNKTSYDCKRRWKHIRDSFNRCKRKMKRPAGSESCKIRWALFEKLKFLDSETCEQINISSVHTCEDQDPIKIEEDNEEVEDTQELQMNTEDVINEEDDEISEEEIAAERLSEESTSNEATTIVRRKIIQHKQNSALKRKLKERDRKRKKVLKANAMLRTMTTEEADLNGIRSFCSHIGSILTKLPPVLRVEAKSKVFNIMAEYEMKAIYQ